MNEWCQRFLLFLDVELLLTFKYLYQPLRNSLFFTTDEKHSAVLPSSFMISLLNLYPWTSVPAGIKDAAGCREYTIFLTKGAGSHLIKKGGRKTLAGQWERSRIDQPVSLRHHIIFVWQHHPKVEVHPDFSWTECLTSNTRLKRGCRIFAGPNENINC